MRERMKTSVGRDEERERGAAKAARRTREKTEGRNAEKTEEGREGGGDEKEEKKGGE
jgi:hypothetical protein